MLHCCLMLSEPRITSIRNHVHCDVVNSECDEIIRHQIKSKADRLLVAIHIWPTTMNIVFSLDKGLLARIR